MTSTIKEHLIAARALIDTPEKWRKDGIHTEPTCCAIVATNRVVGSGQGGKVVGLWAALYEALPREWKRAESKHQYGWRVGDFNDASTTTHADIMALFDRAIAAQELSHAG